MDGLDVDGLDVDVLDVDVLDVDVLDVDDAVAGRRRARRGGRAIDVTTRAVQPRRP